MNPERWQKLDELFQAALGHPTQERAAFLTAACDGDDSLRREVEALLKSDSGLDGELDEIARGMVADWAATNDREDLIGRVIGRYKIVSRLATGGMGEIYLAQDVTLDRKVALKFLPQLFTQDADRLRRFEQEARAASALNHPNILTIYEVGEWEHEHFIATEYIEGGTLREQLEKRRLPYDHVLDIGCQAASALAAAHSAGIVHRDIKPANIMLRDDGYIKLLDFGLAKLTKGARKLDVTEAGRVMGTINYMSPEQALGQPLDHRTDVFSLGVVLYELATGHRLFEGRSEGVTYDRLLHQEPPPMREFDAALSPAFEQVVRRALEKDPARRYQTAADLRDDLKRLAQGSETQAVKIAVRKRRTRTWSIAAVAMLFAAGAVLFFARKPTQQISALAAPTKSIAVLPFDSLSSEKENIYFADGMQDQILTNLAKIADLKVISRTSVMQYKAGLARNVREIGRELGVNYLLEGSVQRSGGQVRVNAQLVNAASDSHVWAETYDRNIADLFGIQSEIAKAIADQLQAKLSPTEKKAIEQPPTTDLAAFELYSRAKSLLLTRSFSATQDPDVRKAIELLNEAVKRDPSFFDAYCQLAGAHEFLYAAFGADHTPARLALAEAATQAATRLRPDAAETYLARANYLYYGQRDYAGALAELESARPTLPNGPRLFELTGLILRRRGQQEEGLRDLQRAVELDPRNLYTLQQIALSYLILRHYAESIATLDRALAIVPDNVETRTARAEFYLYWKGDTRPLHQTIDAILAQGPSAIASAADTRFECALAERDSAAAERALVALGENPCWIQESPIILSHSFGEGLLARMTKDEARGHTAFEAARAEQEKIVQAQPDYGPPLCVLAMIDAALGRKDLALEEGRRAIALMPSEKDVINGSRLLGYFAITAAWAGDKELALQQLKTGLRAPAASQMLSYGALKLHPFWEPLRGDPRFEKIVQSLAPKQ